ncbi:MAG: site-specific DNA-methyltransferase, partial [Promethearchaeota archaeon]
KIESFPNSSKDWNNKLFWGDNLDVLYYLSQFFENQIDLIYIDPPFFSGSNYHLVVYEKENEQKYESLAYRDRWENDLDSYLQMLYERLYLLRKLLSDRGVIFVHLDWHSTHYIRLLLDEIFGSEHFINNIVWYYYNKYSASKSNLPRAHDDILLYSRSNNYTFNELRIPRDTPVKQLKREMVDGVLKNAKDENGNVIYRIVDDKKEDDVWRIPCMQPASNQWTGFPTQKHHKLLQRIIKLASNPDDLILDVFCGSGTTLYAAEKLQRRWIGADISKFAIYLTRKRILKYKKKYNNQDAYSFEIFTHLTQDRKDVLDSHFFQKDLKIKRKS